MNDREYGRWAMWGLGLWTAWWVWFSLLNIIALGGLA